MIGRKQIEFFLIVVAIFATGFWFGRQSVSKGAVVPVQAETFRERGRPFRLFAAKAEPLPRIAVVTNVVEKTVDMTARMTYIANGVTNRFRTMKAYYEFMRKKNPKAYEQMQESRRRMEEQTFDADEKRIEELRGMDLSQLPAEQRADIQAILDFNETINTTVDALNSGAGVDTDALNRRYHDLYQVFEREKKRQVEAYGQALGAANFSEVLEGLNGLTPHQFFQRYWIVNEKLREAQEEKK